MNEDHTREVAKNTATLRDVIKKLCDSKNIFHGLGPPMALFRTPPDLTGAVKTFVYVTFTNDGEKREGTIIRGDVAFGEALQKSTRAFDAWLQPKRTLAWRSRPEVEKSTTDCLWRVYWRCVQLDDGARSIPVEWVF